MRCRKCMKEGLKKNLLGSVQYLKEKKKKINLASTWTEGKKKHEREREIKKLI